MAKNTPRGTQQSRTSAASPQELTRLRRLLEHQGRELRRLAAVVGSSQDAIFCVAVDGTLLTWNDGARRIFGYEAEDILGKPVSLLIPADLMQEEAAVFRRVLNGARIEHYETARVHQAGMPITVSLSISAMRDSRGGIIGASLIARDITERKRAERRQAALLEYQVKIARFGQAALVQREAAALIEYAVQDVLEGVGAQAVAYLERGVAHDELVVRALARAREGLSERSRIVKAGASPLLRVLASGLQYVADEAVAPFEGAQAAARTAIVPVPGETNVRGVLCALGSPADVHAAEDLSFVQAAASVLSAGLQRIEGEHRLAVMAQFDALTGLPNRTLLADRLAQTLARARRHSAPVAILFVDFDDFKSVNDSLGQAAGDEVLKESGRRLQAAVRTEDTVARFSGDEFIVLLAELGKPEDAGLVAQKIIDQFASSFRVAHHELFIGASIGIAAYPADGDTPDALIGAAEAAMHRAKSAGGAGYRFFTADIDRRIRFRAKIAAELGGALERQQLKIAYQPKIDLRSGVICGAEALLRWNHPEHGVLSPADFIPILEDTALIVPVGEWVLRQACRDLKTWMDNGIQVQVAVNLSARHFGQHGLDSRIADLIHQAGIPPSLIELEITESQVMQDPDHAIHVMRGLRGHGIGVAVDDFGTGYSSLAYLARFPVSAVKIDRSFVAGVERQESEAAIVRTIIEMARALGFAVIAEGVENAEQLAFLRRFGCDQAQGYLFSRPLAANDFHALLSSWKELRSNEEPAPLPQPVADASAARRWGTARGGFLIMLLVVALLQYYAIDVLLQIFSLPQLTIFTPAVAPLLNSIVEMLPVMG